MTKRILKLFLTPGRPTILHRVREKGDQQYFGRNFDKSRQFSIILARIILTIRVTEKP